MIPLEEVSPELIVELTRLGEAYGPLGVALTAAQLSVPDAVVQHILHPDEAPVILPEPREA